MYIRRPRGCGARTQPPFSAIGRAAVSAGKERARMTPRDDPGPRVCGADVGATLVKLAVRDDRRRVDLLIRDVYPDGDFLLPGDANAASFAKLARADGRVSDAADLAHGIMGLVGENVALICTGLAARLEVGLIAFGGST